MTTEAPRAPKIKLTSLTPGYLGDIGQEEFLEGMKFTELDLAEVDSTQATYLDCSLSRVNFGPAESPVNLTGARFSGSKIEDCRADTWTMPRGSLIHTEISGTRIGAGVCHDNVWEKVIFSNCRISYFNLRGTKLTDVEFRDCVIDEIDLDRAQVSRVSFPGSSIGVLQCEGSRLGNVDLRGLQPYKISGVHSLAGATIDEMQMMLFAELFASELGIRVE
ncbi:MAG: pentapeptide repeat-containing protein [Brevibacterium sp.]|uniref:pentapeptide repeat-containing protein n=1 Tax=Brevibacterium sp. TaxID=1701 RepID=UPI0026480BF6|nr:pentapeptide repeat-containing protein [Brevibacterium sp.]MDN5833065.1 pentapeptide repeat-containing protein [Brevibacterium sp.]MDN5877855.1 pentapeptide repeat-containing protein [Brevibacterium sp.]MDN5910046.1 pentapeptide repeat-containing protein [Brevibacterium sp.]MDN6133999.1 pentapeptide repeat-containing protein [Brevibacterium sp.]MDN6156789.1 pentapeptide repeat-containing protein [Brevibacterium sp.]